MASLESLRARVRELADPEDARFLQRYFKTGPGDYGEGDVFAGIRVPVLRTLARQNAGLPLDDAAELLRSPVHEERLLALLILVRAHQRGTAKRRREIHELYLAHTRFINNWDLVDSSAEHVVGAQLWEGDRSLLDRLARSESLWERRIAIMATFHFLRRGDFGDTFRIAEMLIGDRHDLIHKAVGWMLREVGKRDQPAEEAFLRAHHGRMPRTMLRYAIERFPEPLRKAYLRGDIPNVSANGEKAEQLGDVIAERVLDGVGEDGSAREIVVRIGRPRPDPEPGGGWGCPTQILGIGQDEVLVAFGHDAIQALQLAFQMIGARLAYPTEAVALTWLGESDLGFPSP